MKRENAIFLLAVLLFLAPALLRPDGLIYPRYGLFTDLTITHWPAFEYLRDSLARFGALPLWRTSILGGTPFAADPVSAMWYPPNWLSLALPLDWFFKLLVVAHLFLAGWSMMLLARSFGVSRVGATAAGIAYAIAPRIAAHLGAGHFTLVEAWAWIPLAVWAARRDAPAGYRLASSGVALGLCTLADQRLAVFAAFIVVAYLLLGPTSIPKQAADRRPTTAVRNPHSTFDILHSLFLLSVAALISAAAWLPALSLSAESTRANLSPAEAAAFSLPPGHLLGTLLASRDNPEYVTFVGLTVLLLAVIGLRAVWRADRHITLWLIILLIVGVLVALGSNTPIYDWLYRLPGVSLLRVPARAWLIITFASALLCGLGVDALMRRDIHTPVAKIWKRLAWLAGLLALLFGAGGAWIVYTAGQPDADRAGLSLIGLAIFVPATIGLALARVTGRLSPARFGALALALVTIELVWVGGSYFRVVSLDAAFEDGRALVEYLKPATRMEDTSSRTYSPSYSLPQHVAQAAQLEMVDGINPLQLARTVRFMQQASGVGEWGYSVTLPAFEGLKRDEDIRTLLSQFTPDPTLLGLLGVKFVVAHFSIAHPDLVEMTRVGGVVVYENTRVLPRTWVVARADVVNDPSEALAWLRSHDLRTTAVVEKGRPLSLNVEPGEADVLARDPDRILVSARGPGLLVLSEVYERDWRASIDGEQAPVYPVDGILRGVYLTDGLHQVEFVYDPLIVKSAVVISATSLISWLLICLLRRLRNPRSSKPPNLRDPS